MARALEVSRPTLWRWTQRPAFRGALDAAQAQAIDGARTRLVGVVERAADVVCAAVEAGDVRTSLAVLKGLRLLGHDARGIEEAGAAVCLFPHGSLAPRVPRHPATVRTAPRPNRHSAPTRPLH